MSGALCDLEVLALDCQATGASPKYGDLLEIGWAFCGAAGLVGPVRSHWIVPRTERPIRRAVRELTGWTEACAADAVEDRVAWAALSEDCARGAGGGTKGAPTVIHFARFELPFLHDLHLRAGGGGDFPFDTVCLHAIAARLFPDLPRRNIRALAGYLGHSPDLLRRSAGHVEATAFIWSALVPLLEEASISSWPSLKAWLEQPTPNARRTKRVYPLLPERRRELPDRAGVYRFLRRNRDVLYVGKATSLRKRVASHFRGRGPATERGLELLTQVHDIDHTETPTLLEAALLEADEIKRLDPPYNVQLRSGERRAWFASSDFCDARPAPDAAHSVGPLPSSRALSPLSALIALARETPASPDLLAAALAVPRAFLPDEALFREGWSAFSAEHLRDGHAEPRRRVLEASRTLWVERGRSEAESNPEQAAPDAWDLARVLRRLERSLVQAGLLVRRARFLCLLADGTVAFRERGVRAARCLTFSGGEIVDRTELDRLPAIAELASRPVRPLDERRAAFDAAVYDRLRVLLTELSRVLDEGGDVALRLGSHTFMTERVAALMRGV